MRLAFALAALLASTAPALPQGQAAPFTVQETGRGYASLQEAVSAIGEGRGTIRIAPGRYGECAVQEAGEISFVSEVPGKAIFDRAICEGKATLVLRGRGAKVDGIVFMRTLVEDGNGAGIRLETGDLHVTNAMFIDGQCGILTASFPRGRITIERSTFAGLGKDPTGNGAHALYIGDYGSLRIFQSRFERGTGGHYVKVRAPRVEILDSSFDDSQGSHTNYAIDLSNGASGRIAGNSFEQGPNKDNYSTMIAVAPEGAKHSSEGLVIEGNKAWLSPAFKERTTFVGNWSRDALTLRNNDLADRIAPIAQR
ncbi:right-handed parallel beta-helix repeat-containing protein [Sphingomonas sp. BT-65]|uniref:right-handed parallel beta-helix repeat-containing protein n=1 Tax=Sphingomonas sp. BT-65 TaxID=2989821 RepID=UPI0022368384|nr:right-handed parallel beta-helix repeat-containing protein [Sphingomonas sp. BT-65]MCW4463240.1 right-handed parallel beta-helix repeat-containing protein [Sphingomonas sp. BT-65]